MEVVKNEPFEGLDFLGGKYTKGQYTYKIYHVDTKVPPLLRWPRISQRATLQRYLKLVKFQNSVEDPDRFGRDERARGGVERVPVLQDGDHQPRLPQGGFIIQINSNQI